MKRPMERQRYKARLVSQIQQQRLDLAFSRRDWLAATHAYDRGWNRLVNLRAWVLVASSVAAIWNIRHPDFLLRQLKRGFGVWSTWRLVKSALCRR